MDILMTRGFRVSLVSRFLGFNDSHETMKPMKPWNLSNHWNHETLWHPAVLDTRKFREPRETSKYPAVVEIMKSIQPWNLVTSNCPCLQLYETMKSWFHFLKCVKTCQLCLSHAVLVSSCPGAWPADQPAARTPGRSAGRPDTRMDGYDKHWE